MSSSSEPACFTGSAPKNRKGLTGLHLGRQLLAERNPSAQDFTSAVMDVDYSPTGREFVAGSYDRSVRIFAYNGGHSREVYHTKRMQRVFAVRFSGDASYVFSGSDDMNLRVWKVRKQPQYWKSC